MDALRIFTVGHSNHGWEVFLGLLRGRGVRVVADVRSAPRSRFAHFGQDRLRDHRRAINVNDPLFAASVMAGLPAGADLDRPGPGLQPGRNGVVVVGGDRSFRIRSLQFHAQARRQHDRRVDLFSRWHVGRGDRAGGFETRTRDSKGQREL